MIFLLLLIIFILLLLKYNFIPNYSTPYVLSPDIIVMGVFIISLLVASLNYSLWGDISETTFFVVLLSLMMFNFGSFVVRKNSKIHTKPILERKTITQKVILIVILYMAIVTYLDYKDMVAIAGQEGLGLFALIALARKNLYIEDTAVEHSALLFQCLYICRAFSYLFIYIICYKKVFFNEKVGILYYIPIVIYVIQALLSTGRTDFIYLTYTIIIISYLLIKAKRGWTPKKETAFFKYISGGLFIFVIIFLLLGSNRSTEELDIGHSVRNYMGSSIMAYDWYLNHYGTNATASFWGEQTMLLYYSIAKSLGLTKLTGVAVLPECYVGGEMTNIYTCLYRYTHDYGIYVMFIILFFLGYLYTSFFYDIKNKSRVGLSIIIYAYLSCPLVEFAIEERFMSTMLSTRTFYCCIYMAILYKLFIRKNEIKLSCK